MRIHIRHHQDTLANVALFKRRTLRRDQQRRGWPLFKSKNFCLKVAKVPTRKPHSIFGSTPGSDRKLREPIKDSQLQAK